MRTVKIIFGILHELRTLFLLLATQMISAAFTIFKDPPHYTYPDDDPYTEPYFYLVNVEVAPNTFWYFLFQRVIAILFASYIVFTGEKFRTALWIFLIIHVIDLIDYRLSYNWVWFYVSEAPMSWNVLKCVVFMLAIGHEFMLIAERKLQIE